MPAQRSLTDRALIQLREGILNLQYPPGEPLVESKIAADLAISRTPVREALRKLEQEGLVRVVPSRGVFVSEIGLRDVAEIFQMREALEVYAAGLAAKRAPTDEAFRRLQEEFANAYEILDAGRIEDYFWLSARLDEQIARACGNGRIDQALRSLLAQARRLRRVATFSSSRLRETVGEHQEILRAIIAHDNAAAEQAVRVHTARSQENLIAQLLQQSSFDDAGVAFAEREGATPQAQVLA